MGRASAAVSAAGRPADEPSHATQPHHHHVGTAIADV